MANTQRGPLIFQRNENYLQINLVPQIPMARTRQGVYLGHAWDLVLEEAAGYFYKGCCLCRSPLYFATSGRQAKRQKLRPGAAAFIAHDDAQVKLDQNCSSGMMKKVSYSLKILCPSSFKAAISSEFDNFTNLRG